MSPDSPCYPLHLCAAREAITRSVQACGGSVMVWGCFFNPGVYVVLTNIPVGSFQHLRDE